MEQCKKIGAVSKTVSTKSIIPVISATAWFGWLIGRLNCCWSWPAQSSLVSGLLEIHDQEFCSLLDMYMFRSGPSNSMRGSVGLSLVHFSYLCTKRLIYMYLKNAVPNMTSNKMDRWTDGEDGYIQMLD
jgi:hypothetical protein